MSRSISKKISKIEKKRQQLFDELFAIEDMVQGSFCLIHVKCGKKYCRCNRGELHPHYRMSMRRNGVQVSRAVPKEDYEWLAKVTSNYKKFRKIRKEISILEKQISQLLDLEETGLIEKSSKGKSYLEI